MELPDFRKILLKALEYPEYAISEYFNKEQEKSGWSKGTFFSGLYEAFHVYSRRLQMAIRDERWRLENAGTQKDVIKEHLRNIALDLKEETEGILNVQLTDEKFEYLYYLIKNAEKFKNPAPIYNGFQVWAFIERGLRFIKNQFEVQLNIVEKPFPYNGKKCKYELYEYSIITDAPFFDFIRFKDEARNLLLNSINKDEFKRLLVLSYNTAKQIVELWNRKLYSLQYSSEDLPENEVSKTRLLIEFDESNIDYTVRVDPPVSDLFKQSSRGYTNVKFAQFAANVATLLNGIISTEKYKHDMEAKKPDEILMIEKELSEVKEKMSDGNYNYLVSALAQYFETGMFPNDCKELQVGKVNIKKFGWALNKIYRNKKADNLPYEYLLFAKENISTFKDVELNKNDLLNSRLYKYFTTKPQ